MILILFVGNKILIKDISFACADESFATKLVAEITTPSAVTV